MDGSISVAGSVDLLNCPSHACPRTVVAGAPAMILLGWLFATAVVAGVARVLTRN
ncbi:hypothetical protein GCM10010116_00860 [Microbispora rosea subsp. aerata]|nr:hypothetical protein [Microbispora rosea]GGO00574.1 hypothetical protein GCM10010116_00860 [Microbispora rosea subsp. aerata]